MFNLNKFKFVKELKNNKPQSNWLQFINEKNSKITNDEFLNSIIEENKFVQEELKLRAMVEDMLVQEFSESIKSIKSYDFLVDSVVNRLKEKQNGEISISEDIE